VRQQQYAVEMYRSNFSYPVINRYPAKKSGIFAAFLTEVAVKRASAADGGSENFTGCRSLRA